MDPEVVKNAFLAAFRLTDRESEILLNMIWLEPMYKPSYFGNAVEVELALDYRIK